MSKAGLYHARKILRAEADPSSPGSPHYYALLLAAKGHVQLVRTFDNVTLLAGTKKDGEIVVTAVSSTSSATRWSTGPGVGVGGRVGVAMICVSFCSTSVDETLSYAELVASLSVIAGVAVARSEPLPQAASR
jgi:hypothetical protein